MEIINVEISSLIPDPNNARTHDEKNLNAIKGSLAKFGQQTPIVIDSNNVILKGNGTVEAAKLMGWDKIDTVRSTLSTNTEKVAYALADNRSSELAAWDMEVLGSELLALQDDDFDIGEIGFDADEFLDAPVVAGSIDDDEVPDVQENIHGVATGDIWVLGDHRIMCGDSTDSEMVAALMDGVKADMVFTDPPYNVNYESKTTGKIQNDNMSDADFGDFIRSVMQRIYESVDSGFIYIWHATMVVEFDNIIREFDWDVNNKICWVKDIPSYSMARYRWQYEPCYFVLKGNPKWHEDRTRTNVWNVKSIQSAGSIDDTGNSWFKGGSKNLTLHPTQKPVDLCNTAIEDCRPSKVLDLFLGSGSTLIACEKTKRSCYGMEIDPHYCSVIIERWQQFTGDKAERLS